MKLGTKRWGLLVAILSLAFAVLTFVWVEQREAERNEKQAEEYLLEAGDLLRGMEGIAVFSMGREPESLEMARRLIEKAREIKPDEADVYRKLGLYHLSKREFEAADQAFQKADVLQPGNTTTLNYLGLLRYSIGRRREAIDLFERAIDANPGNSAAYANLGNALSDSGDITGGIKAYAKAVELDPSNAQTYYQNASTALGENGAYAASEEMCRLTLDLGKRDDEIYISLGIALQGQGKLKEAEAAYRKAVELAPKDAVSIYNLGVVLREQGRDAEAVVAFLKALDLPRPANHLTKDIHGASNFNLGLTYVRQNDHQAAVFHFRRAVSIEPLNFEAYKSLISALRKLGREEEALEVMRLEDEQRRKIMVEN